MTYTRTHTSVALANPYLTCDQCKRPVAAWHDPERCGCDGKTYNLPCEHQTGSTSVCPSWSPVDKCQCPERHWGVLIDRYFDRELNR